MSKGVQLPEAPTRDNRHLKLTMLATVIFLLLVFGGLFQWKQYLQSHAATWQPQAVPVTAMTVVPQTLPQYLNAVAVLKAVQQVTLSAEVAGRVAGLSFHSGQKVSASQLLLQLNDGPEQAQLLTAQAKAHYAEQQLARSRQLTPSGAESLDVLQARQSALAQAQGEVKQVQALIRQKQLIAPFEGELGIRQVNLGQYLNPGEEVVTLTALNKLYVEFTLPQQQFSAIKIGSEVEFSSDVYPDSRFTATVQAIEPQIDAETRNIRIQGILDNPNNQLRPGMYVNAALVLPPQADAILVPATAVETSAQGYSVVVVKGKNAEQHGNAEIVSVEIGKRSNNQIQIVHGLKSGDVVVTVGQNRLQPGADVIVQSLVPAEGN